MVFVKDFLKRTMQMKNNYDRIKNALPWFDAAVYEKEKPAFPEHAIPVHTDFAKTAEAMPDSNILKLKADGIQIIRYNSEKCPFESIRSLFDEMIRFRIPLSVLHTQMDFETIEELAAVTPELNIIIESGNRKLIYHIEKVFKALRKFPNIYLCSYNFCNWQGHEKLISEGLSKRLIYGSHAPVFSADVMMAPIIMAKFSWEKKCDFAGNNLRSILGMDALWIPEIKFNPPDPFIIDAHSHNLKPGTLAVNGFPTPDMDYSSGDWTEFMDMIAIEKLILIPSEALFSGECAMTLSGRLLEFAPGRFSYMEVFNPTLVNRKYLERFRNSLRHPDCVGIKIHPSTHKVEGDDNSYEQVFQIAEESGKPIMTHSWDVSDYNQVQYMSHPDRFRKHLTKYHETPFVLGHAGGRPGAFDATVKLCEDFKNVYVDFAGDYYHNGVLEAFAGKIGTARMLYASDIDWFDPRCNLGLFLGSGLDGPDLLKTLRDNALKIYFP
jgi:hypothetical protein